MLVIKLFLYWTQKKTASHMSILSQIFILQVSLFYILALGPGNKKRPLIDLHDLLRKRKCITPSLKQNDGPSLMPAK